ncbi:MAG: FHA domain-containing protein [Elusimicrobia bacterium]|nr:FHA domain-containing protein [Elusimicrobiota bacterium]
MAARLVVTRAGVPDRCVPLTEGAQFIIGRAFDATVSVPDEENLSRRHARIRLHDGRLHVERLDPASQPVTKDGVTQDSFQLAPGEHFLIGRTRFLFEKA